MDGVIMISAFSPIVASNSKILILGSIPSVKSLTEQQYYGNPQNAFWWIMGHLLRFDNTIDYKLRTSQLLENKIALWDVLQSCERQGSLDSAIKSTSIVPNDFKELLQKYPSINKILFNGTKSETEFKKRVLPTIKKSHPDIQYQLLPSSSPAMATLSKSAKLAIWKNSFNNLI